MKRYHGNEKRNYDFIFLSTVHSPTYIQTHIFFGSFTVDSLRNRDIEKTAKEEDDMTKPKMTTPPRITEPAGRPIVNTIFNQKKTFQSVCNRYLKKKNQDSSNYFPDSV